MVWSAALWPPPPRLPKDRSLVHEVRPSASARPIPAQTHPREDTSYTASVSPLATCWDSSCFLFFDGSCTSRRPRVAPASATTQTPWRKDRRRLPLRRSLQNGLYPTQQRNHGRLRITFARGGHNHHGITLLKIT